MRSRGCPTRSCWRPSMLADAESRAGATPRPRPPRPRVASRREQQELGALQPRWARRAARARASCRALDAELASSRPRRRRSRATVERVGSASWCTWPTARGASWRRCCALAPLHEVGEQLQPSERSRSPTDAGRRCRSRRGAVRRRAAACASGGRGSRRRPSVEEQLTQEMERSAAGSRSCRAGSKLRRTEWVRDRQEAETRRSALRAQYHELREQQRQAARRLGEEGACPTCSRPAGRALRGVLEVLDDADRDGARRRALLPPAPRAARGNARGHRRARRGATAGDAGGERARAQAGAHAGGGGPARAAGARPRAEGAAARRAGRPSWPRCRAATSARGTRRSRRSSSELAALEHAGQPPQHAGGARARPAARARVARSAASPRRRASAM